MASRLKLHEELCELLGTRNVYFQPPESLKLIYPCIVYHRSDISKLNANNRMYISTNGYDGMIIDRDPDSEIPNKVVAHFEMCSLSRSFRTDNLNHTPFKLYY